jgi:hypothetical protein
MAVRLGILAWLTTAIAITEMPGARAADATAPCDPNNPAAAAKLLSDLDVWILPQPKSAAGVGGHFDLATCQGIRLLGSADKNPPLVKNLTALLGERSGIALAATSDQNATHCITLGLFADGTTPANLPGIAADELKDIGPQGYVLHVDANGITAAATGPAGLHYASQTIAQIANGRTSRCGKDSWHVEVCHCLPENSGG